MSIENTIATLVREQTKAQAQADALAAAIKALGGPASATGKPAKRRKRGGWPAGKPRGPRKPVEPANDTEAVSVSTPEPVSPIKAARAKRAGASLAEAAS